MKLFYAICLWLAMFTAMAAEFSVESEWKSDLFVAKYQTFRLEHYRIVAEAPIEGLWRLGDREIGRGAAITLARPIDAPPVEVRDAANADGEWLLLPPPAPNPGIRPVNCDVTLKWFVPELLYDDELRDFDWEVTTKLPAPCDYEITITPDRDNPLFPAHKLTVPLRGRALDDRFGPGAYHKSRVELQGGALKEPLTVEWRIAIPGLELCRKTLRFVPVEQLQALTTGADGRWYDADGALVVPVLHRKALSEQRTLELVKSVGRSAAVKRKVLVLCENFGLSPQEMLGPYLRDNLIEAGYELIFVPWFAPEDTASEWGSAIPRALQALSENPVDQIVIVPPADSRRTRLRSDTEWLRLTDLLLHAAWRQPEVKRVLLATPLPDPTAPGSTAYVSGLRRLLRDSDTKLVELAVWFEMMPAWRDSYRPTADNAAERSSHPLLATQEIAALLTRAITAW